jgi:hypothetical protein
MTLTLVAVLKFGGGIFRDGVTTQPHTSPMQNSVTPDNFHVTYHSQMSGIEVGCRDR